MRECIKKQTASLLKRLSKIEANWLYTRGELNYDGYLRRIAYPQTWQMKKYFLLRILRRRWYHYKGTSRRNPLYLYIAVEVLCGILTGHEVSVTEYGYGGGKFIDRNCRWCDKAFREPIEESHGAFLVDILNDWREQDGKDEDMLNS